MGKKEERLRMLREDKDRLLKGVASIEAQIRGIEDPCRVHTKIRNGDLRTETVMADGIPRLEVSFCVPGYSGYSMRFGPHAAATLIPILQRFVALQGEPPRTEAEVGLEPMEDE